MEIIQHIDQIASLVVANHDPLQHRTFKLRGEVSIQGKVASQ